MPASSSAASIARTSAIRCSRSTGQWISCNASCKRAGTSRESFTRCRENAPKRLQPSSNWAGFKRPRTTPGSTPDRRQDVQEQFIRDDLKIVVATVAFGMGIDKPDVRFVVHYDLPKHIEGYYQETGRAGRDGLAAEALLLFGAQDVVTARRLIDGNENPEQRRIELHKLQAMIGLAESLTCRRRVLLGYFGEQLDTDCGNCDLCLNPPATFDASVEAQKALVVRVPRGRTVRSQTCRRRTARRRYREDSQPWPRPAVDVWHRRGSRRRRVGVDPAPADPSRPAGTGRCQLLGTEADSGRPTGAARRTDPHAGAATNKGKTPPAGERRRAISNPPTRNCSRRYANCASASRTPRAFHRM